MLQRYILRLKVFFCLMFFFWHSGAFSSQLASLNELSCYAGIKDTDFSQDSECTKVLAEIVKNYTKEFGIDFFRLSEGREVIFGHFDSGKSYLVIYLNGNMPYISDGKLKKDSLEIGGKEYTMWYELDKGLILMGNGRLVVSNDFGNFLSRGEIFDKNSYLELTGNVDYEYFIYEKNSSGEFYGRRYSSKLSFKTKDEKKTYYYLKEKGSVMGEIDLSRYIPKKARVEGRPVEEFLKKVLFGGLAGMELDSEFLKSKLRELNPIASYSVNFDGGEYLLVYAKGASRLKEVLKELYSSLFFYREMKISSKDGYGVVELPLIGFKKYFLKLEKDLFVLTDSASLAIYIKNGKYENPKYNKVDLSSLDFGNELVRFYEDKIEVVER